ncbi:putative protein HIGH ARSENIC CONTENT 1, mitochondrial [Cocos nucifera]|uniref:Rhodanese domain-containing protein n=1 Tax=Cocos nucifera TaxID=13894 RepID=A0A8K0ILU4_COCNU|nr:putative protein HIGH ARSENIC CONTENT 1, mitochondrial [Cocos nucifera]
MASCSMMKWFRCCNAIALCLLFLWPSLSGSSEEVATVDVHAAKRLVSSGHRYLDVRTVEEFNKGHLENAINVPYLFFTPQGKEKNPKFLEQVSLVCDKDDHIVVVASLS